MTQQADIIVIGGGIAGMSAAAEMAADANVILLEMESQPGYHATGRSAAFFAATYGNDVIRGMTAASESFYRSPPEGFTEVDMIRPRPCIFVGREDQAASIDKLEAEVDALHRISVEEAEAEVPIFNPGYLKHVVKDTIGGDLDVDAALQGYLKLFRARGGELVGKHEVKSLQYQNGVWQIQAGDETYSAPVVVNAAGGWADPVAELAGLGKLDIVAMRRTALLIDAPDGLEIEGWPLVIDADEEFYFKPDAGALLISPADETPTPACDAQADEMDIAIAVDRFMTATNVQVRRINHKWAGLRTFAPDKTFVVGFDPRAEGFFWLAGQGGYGVQSAPGVAQLSAHLVTGMTPSGDFASVTQFKQAVDPTRLIS